MTRKSTATVAITLMLALAGCDADGDADAGPTEPDAAHPQPDAGADAGPELDAGPPETFVARFVNNIPGHTAVDVCMWTTVEDAIVPADTPGLLLTPGDVVVPFRGVSSYIEDSPFFLAYDVVDFLVALYSAGDFEGTCPSDPIADDAPSAVHIGTILGAELVPDARFTIIAAGLVEGTLGAADGQLPSRCGPTLDAPCDEADAARLFLVRDDPSEPGPGEARLRVSNQITNAPAGFNVCYDPDLVPSPSEPGVCAEPASSTEPTLLFANVIPRSVTDYHDLDPIAPSDDPAPGVGGGLYLVLDPTGSTGCPPFDALPPDAQRCYPILDAFPSPPPSENIRPSLRAGDVSTLFLSGAAGASDPYGASMLLWQDNFASDDT